jgi:hypothetical protein
LTVNLTEAQKSHGENFYIPGDALQNIHSVKFVNGYGATELVVSIEWVD